MAGRDVIRVTHVDVQPTHFSRGPLKAWVVVTFDDVFVVRDIKVIELEDRLMVAMPSRPPTVRCTHCGTRNPLRALYCNQCGKRKSFFSDERAAGACLPRHCDIAHPINGRMRALLEQCVLTAYRRVISDGTRREVSDGQQ